jgi:transmembrane sensor
LDDLIIRALQGRAGGAQLERLRAWRAAHPDNERRFQEMREAWEAAGAWEGIDTGIPIPTAEQLIPGLTRPTPTGPPQRHGPPPSPVERTSPLLVPGRDQPRWRVPAIAAVLLLSLGIGYVATADRAENLAMSEQFRAGPTSLATVVLSDGSVVRLAPGSGLEARMSDGARELTLEGRAFFAVVGDPDRPLTVTTPRGEARVLGTRFELRSEDDGLHLLVVEGRVALAAGSARRELEAGEIARAVHDEQVIVSRVQSPEELLDWMGPWVAFEATPMSHVARELEVRFGVSVEIADPSVRTRTVSGWIEGEDLDGMIGMICSVADVRCSRTGDRLRMDP